MASEFVKYDMKTSSTGQQVLVTSLVPILEHFQANLQIGSNTGASQAGSTAFGTSRPVNPAEFMKN